MDIQTFTDPNKLLEITQAHERNKQNEEMRDFMVYVSFKNKKTLSGSRCVRAQVC